VLVKPVEYCLLGLFVVLSVECLVGRHFDLLKQLCLLQFALRFVCLGQQQPGQLDFGLQLWQV
jgi:hypothetical protein